MNIESEGEELLLEEQLDPAEAYWIGFNDLRFPSLKVSI